MQGLPESFEADEDINRVGDGRLAGQSIPLQVKNTFIDVDDYFIQDGEAGQGLQSSFRKRQVSEPVPSMGAAGGRAMAMMGLQSSYLPESAGYESLPAEAGEVHEPPSLPRQLLGLDGAAPAQGKQRGREKKAWTAQEDEEPMRVETSGRGLGAAMAGAARPAPDAGLPGVGADLQAALQGGMMLANARGAASPASPPPEWATATTVMMRNLPNKYSQRMLLSEINHTGFLGTFDFLYLPIDPDTLANRGYAFLNFIDPGYAWMFKMSYEGRKMSRFNSNKVVSVAPATLQGFEANHAHYAAARVNRGDPSARPLFLREPQQPQCGQMPGGGCKRGNLNRRRGNNAASSVDQQQPQQQQQQVAAMQHHFLPVNVADGTGTYFDMPRMEFDRTPYPASHGMAPHAGVEGPSPMVPKFCPHCGGSIQQLFQFCPQCGGSLDFSTMGQ